MLRKYTKMEKQKVFFVTTYPTQSNGYARVGNIISNYLAEKYDIFYFGLSHYKGEGNYVNRYIDPRIKLVDVISEEEKRNDKQTYGVGILEEFLRMIQPDIIFLYNDIIVSCRYYNITNQLKNDVTIKKFKIINYLDLVYDFEKPRYVEHINRSTDKILVFSKHWKTNLENMSIDNNKIEILHHGFDKNLFVKVSTQEAKQALGFSPDSFIIFNNNRNSYRKALDLTIGAFIMLLISVNFDSKFRLVLNCNLEDPVGYDIRSIIITEALRHKINPEIILNNFIYTMGINRLSDEKINLLYNASEIGINTCIGEGFGLCNLEHASLGKPQVVSRVGAFKDIFKNYPQFLIEPVTSYNISNHTDDHNGVAFLCRKEDYAMRLLDMYNNYSRYLEIAERCSQEIHDKYCWEKILPTIDLNTN